MAAEGDDTLSSERSVTMNSFHRNRRSWPTTDTSSLSAGSCCPHYYTVGDYQPNVKALRVVEGERIRFELNLEHFSSVYSHHSLATALNCFGLEVFQFVDSLLAHLHRVPFWPVRVRDNLTVLGYMIERPCPIKWTLQHRDRTIQLFTEQLVSRGYCKHVLRAVEQWIVAYDREEHGEVA